MKSAAIGVINAPEELKEALLSISNRCVKLPDRDSRSGDDILGYDADGLPR